MNLFVIISASWGEVDWLLPVLHYLKNTYQYNITVFFKTDKLYNAKVNYIDLNRILNDTCDIILYPKKILKSKSVSFWDIISYCSLKDIIKLLINMLLDIDQPYSTKLLKKIILLYLRENKIDYVFTEYGNSSNTDLLLSLSSKIILFPHGQDIRGTKYFNSSKNKFNDLPDLFENKAYNNAMLWCNDNDEVLYFKNITKLKNIMNIGFPRLNDYWLYNYNKNFTKKKYSKIFTIYLQIGKIRYIGREEITRIVKNIIYYVNKERNCNVMYKLHPRNSIKDINYVKKLFKTYSINRSNIIRSNNSIYHDLFDADIFISTSKSGSCLDAVFQGKPVIENFKYGNKYNRFLEFNINGELTSIYNYYGLVKNISNIKETINIIEDLRINKNNIIKTYQTAAFKKIIKKQDNIFENIHDLLRK